uniref:Succinate dehydrogenase cytochrome b560 subunit, mitochondrial n=1 Tax=Panagrolaimus sp. JU765 TaxID=591449 RepID=A0AC34RE59_9BILA
MVAQFLKRKKRTCVLPIFFHVLLPVLLTGLLNLFLDTMALVCMSKARCFNVKQISVFARQLRTSAVARSDVKTSIQKLGWEYLVKQEASGRPLAPHLTIYKPQLTWMLSGLHRITGCVMAGTLLIGGVGFATLPIDFTTFVNFVQGLNLPTVILAAFKFIVAFPIAFHTLNGIRFIGFDLAKGTDIASVYRSGWFVFGLAALIAVAVVAQSYQQKAAKKLN